MMDKNTDAEDRRQEDEPESRVSSIFFVSYSVFCIRLKNAYRRKNYTKDST